MTVKPYALAWVALVVLAAGSFALSGVALGRIGIAAAFAIAAVKAAIVLRSFMHLREMRASVKLAAIVALTMVALLVGFATADVLTRDPPPMLPRL